MRQDYGVPHMIISTLPRSRSRGIGTSGWPSCPMWGSKANLLPNGGGLGARHRAAAEFEAFGARATAPSASAATSGAGARATAQRDAASDGTDGDQCQADGGQARVRRGGGSAVAGLRGGGAWHRCDPHAGGGRTAVAAVDRGLEPTWLDAARQRDRDGEDAAT